MARAARLVERPAGVEDVLRPGDEGEAARVGDLGDQRNHLAVAGCERRQLERRVREVDAAALAQPAAVVRGGLDLESRFPAVPCDHSAAEATVVDDDPLPRLERSQGRRERARDARRAARGRGPTRGRTGREHQPVVHGEADPPLDPRQRADLGASGGPVGDERRPGRDVGRVPDRRPAPTGAGGSDLDGAPRVARVAQADRRPVLEAIQPRAGDRQRLRLLGRRDGRFLRGEPHPRGAQDAAVLIARRAQPQHLGPGCDGAHAQLRSAQLHDDPARPARLAGRLAHGPRHHGPAVGVVAAAVDAREVHAGGEQAPGQRAVGLARQGHHDPNRPPGPRGAEQGAGALVREGERLPELNRGGGLRRLAAGSGGEDAEDRLHGSQRARLGAAEGRQTVRRERRLDLAQVVAAQRHVLEEVLGARPVGGRDLREARVIGRAEQLAPQGGHGRGEVGECAHALSQSRPGGRDVTPL